MPFLSKRYLVTWVLFVDLGVAFFLCICRNSGMSKHIIISVDPGLKGAITILEGKLPKIYKIPTRKIIVNKKNRNTYDLDAIVDILKSYSKKKVLFVAEIQGVRKGVGSVGAFTAGKGYGSLLGISVALGFKVVEVRSQKWKKNYPELEGNGIKEIREEIRKIKDLNKTIEDKEQKKLNEKHIEKLGRILKAQAKTNARLLCTSLYPEIADNFVKVCQDGLAESLLIALYGKENQGELV
jgi:hypothetical protein